MLEFIHKINWVDVIIAILLLRGIYVGFTQGLSGEFVSFVGIVAGLILAFHYYEFIGDYLGSHTFLSPQNSNIIGFLAIILGVVIITKFISAIIHRIIRVEVVSTLDRVGGVIAGICQGCLLSSLALALLMLTSSAYIESSIVERSLLGGNFLKIGPFVYEMAVKLYPEAGEIEEGSTLEKIMSQGRDSTEQKTKSYPKEANK